MARPLIHNAILKFMFEKKVATTREVHNYLDSNYSFRTSMNRTAQLLSSNPKVERISKLSTTKPTSWRIKDETI